MHSELVEVDPHGGWVKESHDDLFAVECWHDGTPCAELSVHVLHVDASVLGFSSFVDVHSSGEFDSGDDVCGGFGWELSVFGELSIDAESYFELVSFRLQVNIARPCFECIHKDVVDDLDGDGHFLSAHFSDLSLFSEDEPEALHRSVIGFANVFH